MQKDISKLPDGMIIEGPEGIGARMREIRRGCGLTQAELAGGVGVVQQSVSAWERGWTLPGIDMLWAFCAFTGSSADKVLGLPGAPYSCCEERITVAAPDVDAALREVGLI